MERKLLYWTALFLFAVACGRGVDKVMSSSISITIRTPNQLVSSGAGALVALPVGRDACYGINILGAGPSNSYSCSPTTGIVAGFVEAGQSVTAVVPSKSYINIQLFLYLKAIGDTSPCPLLMPYIPSDQIDDTYLVGQSNNIYVYGTDMTVTINGTFPGESQNIAQTLSLPTSCTIAATAGPTSFSVSAGAQTLSSASFSMTARAGKAMGQVLSSGSFKLIVR